MPPRPQIESLIIAVGLCIICSCAGVASCYFTANQASGANAITAWTSAIWTETTTAEFDAGLSANVDTANDEVKLSRGTAGSTPSIFAFGGGGTRNLWRYNIPANTWASMADALAPVNAGGALALDGSDTLYALVGGNTKSFLRYTISTNTWASRADTPAFVNAGGALTDGGGYVYALAGGGTTSFARYTPGTDTWTAMSPAPAPVVEGGSLAYAGGDYIYALAGGGTRTFLRYTISANTWVAMPGVPVAIGEGGALTSPNANTLYALVGGSGGGKKDFYQYSVSTSTWTKRTDVQNPVAGGGALTSDGGAYVYAFRGNTANVFWRYAPASNTWTTLSGDPPIVTWGGSLAYVPAAGGGGYASPGSIASVVLDTATTGSRWDLLAWNASIPSGTAIAFEVRSSDTPFQADASAPSWVPVTGTSTGGQYIVAAPGLPSGRYHQWRATLSSTVGSSTPVLQDVSAYVSGSIASVGGASSQAYQASTPPPAFDPFGIADLFAEPAPSAQADPISASLVPMATVTTIATGNVTEAPTPTPFPNATITPNETLNGTGTPAARAAETPAANATGTPVPTATPAPTATGTLAATETSNPALNGTGRPAGTGAATTTPAVASTVPTTPAPTGDGTINLTATVTAVPTPAPRTLLEVAAADRNLTIFVGMILRADLDRDLEGLGPFTVFAPTDDAFRALPPKELDRCMADRTLLARLLNRHVAEGELAADELASVPAVRMLDGTDVNVTFLDGVPAVEGATVNYTEAGAANGVIHAIDAVLIPVDIPTPTAPPPITLVTTVVPSPTTGTPTGTMDAAVPAVSTGTVAARATTVAPKATTFGKSTARSLRTA